MSEYFCFSWFCVSTDNVFQKIRGTNYQEFLFGDGIQVTIVFKGLNSYDDVCFILVVFVTHILIYVFMIMKGAGAIPLCLACKCTTADFPGLVQALL